MIPANQSAETDLAEFVSLCGSKRLAAKLSGIPRKTLCRWLLDIERTGKINARPSRVRGAMERINAVRAKMRQDGPCFDVADAFMSIFGFQRAGRGDDMTCASFPGKLGDDNVTFNGRPIPEDAVIRNSQTANDEINGLVNTESVHSSRIGDEKARKLPECVVFFPDRHSPYDDKRAVEVAINHCHKKHSPTWVVDGGDSADMYEFSSYLGLSRMDPLDEIYAAVRGLEDISNAFPNCRKTFLVGNHERRIVRYFQTNIPKMAKHKDLSIRSILELERLGYGYHDNKESWEREGKFFKIGKLTYIHGDELGGCGYKYAAQRMAELYRANIIFGHLHVTDASKPLRDLEGHVIRTWGVGCLHTVTPHYRPGASHNLGFAVVEYDEDGQGGFTVYNYLLDDNYKVRL